VNVLRYKFKAESGMDGTGDEIKADLI